MPETSEAEIANFLDAITATKSGNEVKMVRGKVVAVYPGALTVTIGGGTGQVPIKYAASLSPVVDDEVFILAAGPDKVAVFKLAS